MVFISNCIFISVKEADLRKAVYLYTSHNTKYNVFKQLQTPVHLKTSDVVIREWTSTHYFVTVHHELIHLFKGHKLKIHEASELTPSEFLQMAGLTWSCT